MAEASFEQARKTFEKFLAGAQATAGSLEERGATVRSGAKEVSAKAVSYAEKNVQASLDYAQSLLKAKDLTEVMRLHSEYVHRPDAVPGGAGQRNGPARQPRGDGCGPAEKLRFSSVRDCSGAIRVPATFGVRMASRISHEALRQEIALRCTKLTR